MLCSAGRQIFFFFPSADWLYPYSRAPGGWRLQTSAYDVATREGDLKNSRHRSSQLQMGTCQGICHLPLPEIEPCSAAAVDLRHTQKGVQHGEWDTLLQENWWNRSLDSYIFSETDFLIPILALSPIQKSTKSLHGDTSSLWLAEKLWLRWVFDCMNSPFTKITYINLPPLPLWSSLSELSEVLSSGLQSSFCPK